MGSESCIDVSLAKIWESWYKFKRQKRKNLELDSFAYFLESNLISLHQELKNGTYNHGLYRTFELTDTKKRTISVASIKDRIVHRLIYDYLVALFNKSFIYDAWSCRPNKGLLAAIKRAQLLLFRNPYSYVWRSDITKFFDSVDQKVLKKLIERKIKDPFTLRLIDNVIDSFYTYAPGIGMPIGNLTSQIFCNIYLNEFDHYVSHVIRPLGYMRYGDDFIILYPSRNELETIKEKCAQFLKEELKLTIHPVNNIIIPAKRGIHFLGCKIYPTGRKLLPKIYPRIKRRLNLCNIASYRSLILAHEKKKMIKWFDWATLRILSSI